MDESDPKPRELTTDPESRVSDGQWWEPLLYEVGDELIRQIDESVWEVTNRLVDLDNETVVYRVQDPDSEFNHAEMYSESAVRTKFKVVDGE